MPGIRFYKPSILAYAISLVLAVIGASVWLLFMGLYDHPVDQWLAVVVIWYVAFEIIRLVYGELMCRAAIWALGATREAIEQIMGEEHAHSLERLSSLRDVTPAQKVGLVLSQAIFASVVVGLSLMCTYLVLPRVGLTPMSDSLMNVSLWLVGLGLFWQMLFLFGWTALVRFLAKLDREASESVRSPVPQTVFASSTLTAAISISRGFAISINA